MEQQSFLDIPVPTWTVYIDGASRNNPGKAGAGVYIKKDGEIVFQEGFYLATKTNNQAEYLSLLLGLFFVQQLARPEDTVHIMSDSELLVKQMLGLYRVKHEGLQALFMLAKKLFDQMHCHIKHVPRLRNAQADALANEGIDSQKKLPDNFLSLLASHGISI